MKNTEKELSFLDHLEVLRWHLLRASSSILIFATLAFIFKDFVFDQVLLAPMNSNFPTYIFFCNLSKSFEITNLPTIYCLSYITLFFSNRFLFTYVGVEFLKT